MQRILLVEDSLIIGKSIKKRIENELSQEVVWLTSYCETETNLNHDASHYTLGLIDLYLPDAKQFEIVDLVNSYHIPIIVFTSEYNDKIREYIWSKHVVDYIIKTGEFQIDYLVSMVHRILTNSGIKILIVDDSPIVRKSIQALLKIYNYTLFEAENGQKAIELLDHHSDIKIVLTDYDMPQMDGFQLIEYIRALYKKHELPVIGMSSQGKKTMSARFIKTGANDFIEKPFVSEELYCRINQQLELIDYIEKIKDISNKDYLTGLYNRRYLFEAGGSWLNSLKEQTDTLTIALLDIDFFKSINDTYGHDAGDLVLKQLSRVLISFLNGHSIVSRFGGEEFCIVIKGKTPHECMQLFENIRHHIECLEITVNKHIAFRISVSIGICSTIMDTLDEMIKIADTMLYTAKNSGRNRVVARI
ncbi:MAG: diguanylate cyclase [Desulfobacterales bacterium]|nr:diguanylate cyclase [Desulfobacterales bacterium]